MLNNIDMINYILSTVILSLLVSFVIIFYEVSGIKRDLLNMIEKELLIKLLSCNFCLGFWLSLLACLAMVLVTKELSYLFMPMSAAVIIRLIT